ncbi:MAG: hypothetical protein M0Z91_12670 [Actinomycetota bacterium]|nr:hypothetical protein [Actinomycetota bacterium]
MRLGKLSALHVLVVALLSSVGIARAPKFLLFYLYDGRGISLTAPERVRP